MAVTHRCCCRRRRNDEAVEQPLHRHQLTENKSPQKLVQKKMAQCHGQVNSFSPDHHHKFFCAGLPRLLGM